LPGTSTQFPAGLTVAASFDEDVMYLKSIGVKAVLVGETLMRANDIGAKVRELIGKGFIRSKIQYSYYVIGLKLTLRDYNCSICFLLVLLFPSSVKLDLHTLQTSQ